MPRDGTAYGDDDGTAARRILACAADMIEAHGLAQSSPRKGSRRCVLQAIADAGGVFDCWHPWSPLWTEPMRLAERLLERQVFGERVGYKRMWLWNDRMWLFARRRAVRALRQAAAQ